MKNKLIFFRVMNALSDSRRVRILCMLNKKIMCVSDIQKELRRSQSEVSKQLAVLKSAKLVHSFKFDYWGYGRPVYYYLNKAKYVPKKFDTQTINLDPYSLFESHFNLFKSPKRSDYIPSRIDKNVVHLFERNLWLSFLFSRNDEYNYASELLNLLRPHLDF
ncbi:MAG TPA: hypothetical protein DGG95_09685 [Cytophagales bacterium]|nr:hypothetical protein [Cytophagales bacterium]